MSETHQAKTPVHLWIVGVVSALWNSFGCTDYTMTMTRNQAWLSQLTAEQIAWIDAAPAWSEGAWALGVWGALAGSILLLLRSRHAVTAFTVSILGLIGTTLYQYVVAPAPMPGMSDGTNYIQYAIWAVALALLWYAWKQKQAGVLR